MDRDQTTLAGSGRRDHADHQGVRETAGTARHPKVARGVNNGAKIKLLSALAKGPRTLEDLVMETGLSRKQVAQNMHYLKMRGIAHYAWFMPDSVSRLIRVVGSAVEEARA